MIQIKDILFEDPEFISINNGDYLLDYTRARYTLLLYDDIKSKKVEWIAYQYSPGKILCSNESLTKDMTINDNENNDFISRMMFKLDNMPSHTNLREVLTWYRYKYSDQPTSRRSVLDGRLYEYQGNWYIAFWQNHVNELLLKHKTVFDDFLRVINLPYHKLFIENDRSGFDPYVEIFKQNSNNDSTTELQKKMKQMSWDLHVKKAQLDKSIVNVLQTKPKDLDTLYQRLEKEFGMPIAKIKHLYGAIPLDKLISKKAKELRENKLGNHLRDEHGWVGVVRADGSVIIPENQDGYRRHFHYGLDGYPNRFTYFPLRKEIVWWDYPDEEDLSIKVEDYLLRKGFSITRHRDVISSKTIRNVLKESMFPTDFDRHSLGSCMAAAEFATNYLLSKGRSDFKVIEGMVSLYPDQEYRDWSPHTWIQFNNGKIFDPTKKQWSHWGFDPNEVKFEKIKRTYTPEEYLSICKIYPEDPSKFKKMAESLISNDDVKEKYFLLLKHKDVEIPFFYVGKINSLADRSALMGSWTYAWKYNKLFTEDQIKRILKNNAEFMKSQGITEYALEKYSSVFYFDSEIGDERPYDDQWDYTKRKYFLYKTL